MYLGLKQNNSSLPKVDNAFYDKYAKCGVVPNYLCAPTSLTSFQSTKIFFGVHDPIIAMNVQEFDSS
jgi:hypothetical protein